jgi:hypothetical protein
MKDNSNLVNKILCPVIFDQLAGNPNFFIEEFRHRNGLSLDEALCILANNNTYEGIHIPETVKLQVTRLIYGTNKKED